MHFFNKQLAHPVSIKPGATEHVGMDCKQASPQNRMFKML
jgi:hypothetical protein